MSLFQTLRIQRINQQTLILSASALTGAVTVLLHQRNHGACPNKVINNQDTVEWHLDPLLINDTQARVSSDFFVGHHEALSNMDGSEYGISHVPVILAASPMVSDIGVDNQELRKRRWWALNWLTLQSTSSNKNMKRRWYQRIRNTFFVITRGAEIVLRLSPLLIMTPVAVLVSAANSLLGKICQTKESTITLTPGQMKRDDEADLFVHQFEIARATRENPGQTFASNLAWRYALYTLQSLGPAFCKLGQWAATRRDLFPVYMCNRLSELHDMANTHSSEYTYDTLNKAFGNYEERGLTVNGTILGSGSAAQVHKGTLSLPVEGKNTHDTKTVAIKVLHPNTQLLVERDLILMQHIADFIDTCIPFEFIKMLSLPRAVANFSDILRRQVDLRIEGDNLRTFRSNFDCLESNQVESVINFPQPVDGFISECVLVEEYIEAKPISYYLADDSPKGLEIRKKLAGPLLRAFLKMVFIDNFVHADLHPGNVLVADTGKKDTYSIIFLDAGIAMSLDPRDKQNLHDLFKAVVMNDGYTAGSLMVERARYECCSDILGGKHAFASGVGDIVSEFHDRNKQGLTLGAVRIGSLLGRVLDLCRWHGVEIDPAMASVVVSMLVIEGLGRSLDPDLNLMKAAMPFLLGHGKV